MYTADLQTLENYRPTDGGKEDICGSISQHATDRKSNERAVPDTVPIPDERTVPDNDNVELFHVINCPNEECSQAKKNVSRSVKDSAEDIAEIVARGAKN